MLLAVAFVLASLTTGTVAAPGDWYKCGLPGGPKIVRDNPLRPSAKPGRRGDEALADRTCANQRVSSGTQAPGWGYMDGSSL